MKANCKLMQFCEKGMNMIRITSKYTDALKLDIMLIRSN